MKKLSTPAVWPLLLAGLVVYTNPAPAQSFWDPGHLNASPGSGGPGPWDNSTLDWWVSGSSDVAWSPTNIANFEGSAGTVTVGDNVVANALNFTTPNYVVASSGAFTLTLTNGTPDVTVPAGTTTISATIAGTNGLIATGGGTLVLSGANTFTGGTLITNGTTVSVNAIADTGPSALGSYGVGITNNLTLGGGTLAYTGATAVTGRPVSASTGTTSSIDVPPGGSLTLTNAVKGTATSFIDKIDSGTLILAGNTDNSGLLMNVNGGTLVLNKASASTAHGLGGGASSVASGATLQLSGSGGFDLFSSCTLTVNSGGVFDLNGQNDTFGSLTVGGVGSGSGAVINNSGATAGINPTSGVILTAPTTIGGSGSINISNKLTGNFLLTYAGTGTLTLSSNGPNSGGLNINSGTVQLKIGGAAGTGTIALATGATLTVNGASTVTNVITSADSTGIINVDEPSGNTFLTGSLSGFTGTINCLSANNTSGQLVINNANNAANPLSASATWNLANGATLDLATPYVTDAASVIVNGTGNNQAFGSFRLDACNQTGNVLLNGNATIGDGNANSPSEISGVISDGGHGNGFTFVGTGAVTLLLGAVNTYSGATVVSNGTLALTGVGSIGNSSSIALANGTTFDVSGVSGGALDGANGYELGASQTLATLGGSCTIAGNLDASAGSPLSFLYNTGNMPMSTTGLNLSENPVTVTIPTGVGFPGGGGVAAPLAASVLGDVSTSPVTIIQANSSFTAGNAPTVSISGGTLFLTVNNPVITSYSPFTTTNLFIFTTGVPPTFSITANGSPSLAYQWYSNGFPILGANGTSFTYTQGTLPAGKLTNYVVASDSTGATTNFWVLNVVATNTLAPYPLAVMQSTNSSGQVVPPIAFWRLDEGDMGGGNTGRPVNDWLGGNLGSYTNVSLGLGGYSPSTDPTETSGSFGTLATSDSVGVIPLTNPDLNMGTTNGATVNFSVEAWVNAGGQVSDAAAVSQGEESSADVFVLAVNANGTGTRGFRFYARTAANGSSGVTQATSTVVPNSTWEHLVGVCDETHGLVSLYLNGVSISSIAVATNAGIYSSQSGFPIVIGGEVNSSDQLTTSYQWKGLIDDVAVYNYALTPADVLAHYNASGAPARVTLPASIDVDAGSNVVLTPTVTGTAPITLGWSDANNSLVPPQTSTNLTIANIAATDTYTIKTTNAYTAPTVPSVAAGSASEVVTVHSGAPSFASPGHNIEPSALTNYVGTSVKFSVLAYGTAPLSYQWFNGSGPITGATGVSFTTNSALGASVYYCSVTGVSPPATSTMATLVGIPQPVGAYSQAILSNNPVAYWRLNEGPDNGSGNTGTVAHDFVGGHNAFYNNVVLSNASLFVDEGADTNMSALFGTFADPNSFAGEINQSSIGIAPIDLAAQVPEFTVEAWAQGQGTETPPGVIVAKGYSGNEEFILQCVSSAGNPVFEFELHEANNVAISILANVVVDNNWHHLVGVYDQAGLVSGAGVHFYVDGQDQGDAVTPIGSGVQDPGSASVQDRVTIGAGAASNSTNLVNQWVGNVSDVALYNYPFSAAQALADFNAGTNLTQVLQVASFAITNVTAVPRTSVTLTWTSQINATYQVQATPTLTPAQWSNIGPVITATDTSTSYTDTSTNVTAGSAAFYRVIGN